jgi:RNA polymerase sigma factor (sigma-70 family)
MPTPDQPHQHAVSVTELFARYHDVIRKHVQGVVNTSAENVEDACMFAWTKFLSVEHDQIRDACSWLATVAIHEAFKLDRRARRTSPLVTKDGEVVDIADLYDELQRGRLLADAGDVVKAAGLSARQAQILGLQVAGFTYEEISAQTGDSRRTIERQILRARHKLAEALSEHRGAKNPIVRAL